MTEKWITPAGLSEPVAARLLTGTLPVLVTAPHAVPHARGDKLKFAEPNTAWLAQRLHEETGAYALIKTDGDTTDPNADEISPFRDAATELVRNHGIRAGIDLHLMNPERTDQVILGTGRGRNIHRRWLTRDIVVVELNTCGIPVLVDEIFPALGEHRVSSDVSHRTGIPYVQIEINSALTDPPTRDILVRAHAAVIRRFAEEL